MGAAADATAAAEAANIMGTSDLNKFAKAAAKKKARGVKHKQKKADNVIDPESVGDTLLEVIDLLMAFVRYLDPTAPIASYRLVCLYASIKGGVLLDGLPGKPPAFVKRWSSLRKCIKREVYRVRKLRPRMSDVDFPDGFLDDDSKCEIVNVSVEEVAKAALAAMSNFDVAADLQRVDADSMACQKWITEVLRSSCLCRHRRW